MPKDVSNDSPMDKKQSVLEEMLFFERRFASILSHSGAVIQGRVIVPGMTRGNQREQDRQKAQKKAAAQAKKPKESASTLAKRKEADAEILRAKQKKAEDAKASSSSGK